MKKIAAIVVIGLIASSGLAFLEDGARTRTGARVLTTATNGTSSVDYYGGELTNVTAIYSSTNYNRSIDFTNGVMTGGWGLDSTAAASQLVTKAYVDASSGAGAALTNTYNVFTTSNKFDDVVIIKDTLIDGGGAYIKDNANDVIKIDWFSERIYANGFGDATDAEVINWQDQELRNGTQATVDWANMGLKDTEWGITVVNWGTKKLITDQGDTIDWNLGVLDNATAHSGIEMWSAVGWASNSTEIVNYERCTNLIATLAGSSPWLTSGSDIYYTAGSVGIGPSTPTEQLHVSNSVSTFARIETTTGDAGIKLKGSIDEWTIQNDVSDTGALNIYQDGTRRMMINNSGGVALGPSFPSAALHIFNTNPKIILEDTAGTGETDNFAIEGNKGVFSIVNTTDNKPYFYATTAHRIGIFTNAPTAELEVAGTVKAYAIDIKSLEYGAKASATNAAVITFANTYDVAPNVQITMSEDPGQMVAYGTYNATTTNCQVWVRDSSGAVTTGGYDLDFSVRGVLP